jgi:hypothetical protein
LRLEGLEGRATPSGGAGTQSPPPYSQNGPVPGTNQPPAITGLAAQGLGGGWFIISGRVIDESPGGLTVTFGGSVATLAGRTVTTAADGSFSFAVHLKTDGSDTGWLLATTTDPLGLESDEASCYVSP